MTINKKKNLLVSVEDRATFEVVLHRVWKGSSAPRDFLGFYVLDSHGMPARTHGLLGMASLAGGAGGGMLRPTGLWGQGHPHRPTGNQWHGRQDSEL